MLDTNNIYNEMMIHIPLCTHIEAKKVLVVGEVDDNFKTTIAQHVAEVTYSEELNIEDTFDVIIYNNDTIDDMIMSNVNRCLEQSTGIFVCTTEHYKDGESKLKSDLKTIGDSFWISMPYRFGHTMAIIGSKKYHPQADIILDRSDFLECDYYSTELQNACFVHPAYITKALTGIAKR
jgi:spermidine synthase